MKISLLEYGERYRTWAQKGIIASTHTAAVGMLRYVLNF